MAGNDQPSRAEIQAMFCGPRQRQSVLQQVSQERDRQDKKFGRDRDYMPERWLMIAGEELGEANQAACDATFRAETDYGVPAPADLLKKPTFLFDLDQYREELLQTAAVCVAAIESLDRLRKAAL